MSEGSRSNGTNGQLPDVPDHRATAPTRPEPPLASRRPELMLDVGGMLIFGLLIFFLYTPSLTRHPGLLIGWVLATLFVYEATVAEVQTARGEEVGWKLLLWGLTIRLPFLILPTDGDALLSGDVYRFLWDGLVVKNGFNPYLISPDSPFLDPLRQLHLSLGTSVEHRSIPSFYPPLAELLFAGVGPDRLLFRQVLCWVDLMLLLALLKGLVAAGRPQGALVRYALLPLPAIEIVGQGHFDGVVAFTMIGAALFAVRGKWLGTGLSLGVAAGLKLIAAVPGVAVLMALGERPAAGAGGAVRSGRLAVCAALLIAVGLVLATVVPFALRGGVGIEAFRSSAPRPEINGVIFSISELLFTLCGSDTPAAWSRVVLALAASAGITCSFLFLRDPFERCAAALGIVIVCAPSLYPWHLLWVAPFLVLIRETGWSVALRWLCTSSLLSYELLRHRIDWSVPWWIMLLEAGLPVAGLFLFRWEQSQWPFNGARRADRSRTP